MGEETPEGCKRMLFSGEKKFSWYILSLSRILNKDLSSRLRRQTNKGATNYSHWRSRLPLKGQDNVKYGINVKSVCSLCALWVCHALLCSVAPRMELQRCWGGTVQLLGQPFLPQVSRRHFTVEDVQYVQLMGCNNMLLSVFYTLKPTSGLTFTLVVFFSVWEKNALLKMN